MSRMSVRLYMKRLKHSRTAFCAKFFNRKLLLPCTFLVRPKTIVFGRTYVLRMMFFSTREISEMRGPTGAKFCTTVSNRPNFIMPVQNLGEAHPKKFQGPKTCKI